jgi:hypothetical protein
MRDELAERRAAEAAVKIRKASEKKEQQHAARQAIVAATSAAGMPETFAGEVVALIEKRSALLKVWDGSVVDAKLLQEFCETAKSNLFSQKLLRLMPPWNFTKPQKAAIVDTVLSQHSFEALSAMAESLKLDSASDVWKCGLASTTRSSDLFTCSICMDALVDINEVGVMDSSRMWFAPFRQSEHWSSQPCGHAFCRTCVKTWAQTNINDHKTRIKCPAVGCSYHLWDQDLQALVDPEVFERYQEHKNADCLKHLKSELKSDVALRMWLKGHARPCPDCHVIVSRYEGCNSMQCVCGCSFCYACGCKSCQCKKEKKRDIWKPRANKNTLS